MTYRLLILRNVRHDVDRLPGHVRQRVRRALASLTVDPRPPAARALHGDLTGYWRLRLEDYRIIHAVDDAANTVDVIRVIRRSPSTSDLPS